MRLFGLGCSMLLVWAISFKPRCKATYTHASRSQVVATEFHLYSCFLSHALLIPAAASRGEVCGRLHDQAFALYFLRFPSSVWSASPLLQVYDLRRACFIRFAATAQTDIHFLQFAVFIGGEMPPECLRLPFSPTRTVVRAIARRFIPRCSAPNLGRNAAARSHARRWYFVGVAFAQPRD
jgi:hypothetical protein